MTKIDYKPECCEFCGQTKTYLLPVDRGTVSILKAVAGCIREKGINCVHLTKEVLEQGFFTSHHQTGNISRPRFHGLVAKVEGKIGNFCLTRKGAKFLKGEPIPRFAIISKEEHRQVGYYKPDEHQCVISDFFKEGEYWEGINFDIKEGEIVVTPQVKSKQDQLL